MTTRKTLTWWAYAVIGVVLFFFLAPARISSADTAAVVVGVLMLVLYAVWSWRLWIRSLIQAIKDQTDDL